MAVKCVRCGLTVDESFFPWCFAAEGYVFKKIIIIIFLNFTSLSESRDASAQHTKAPWFEKAQIPAMVLSGKASGVKKKSAKTNVWIHLLWGPLVNKGTAERRFGSSDTVTVLLWPNSNPNLILKKTKKTKKQKHRREKQQIFYFFMFLFI